jgi:hypothetical protein
MSVMQCLSCDHENPLGSKFCQECGSRLNLKLCKECEAINENAAASCHSCGKPFPVAPLHRPLQATPNKRPDGARSASAPAIAVGVLMAAIIAGGAYFFYAEPGLRHATAEPAAPRQALMPTPAQPAVLSAPAIAPTAQPAVLSAPAIAAMPEVPAAPRPAEAAAGATTDAPKAAAAARGVTHTRARVTTQLSGDRPADPAAAGSAEAPEMRTPPPVTHTKRAVAAQN